MRIIGGYQDTRTNKEDFAITPFIFGVWLNGGITKVVGLGLCWGWFSCYLGIGFNIPKNYPTFKNLDWKDERNNLT